MRMERPFLGTWDRKQGGRELHTHTGVSHAHTRVCAHRHVHTHGRAHTHTWGNQVEVAVAGVPPREPAHGRCDSP